MLIDRLNLNVNVSPMALLTPSYAAADDFLGFAEATVKLGQPTLNQANCMTLSVSRSESPPHAHVTICLFIGSNPVTSLRLLGTFAVYIGSGAENRDIFL